MLSTSDLLIYVTIISLFSLWQSLRLSLIHLGQTLLSPITAEALTDRRQISLLIISEFECI